MTQMLMSPTGPSRPCSAVGATRTRLPARTDHIRTRYARISPRFGCECQMRSPPAGNPWQWAECRLPGPTPKRDPAARDTYCARDPKDDDADQWLAAPATCVRCPFIAVSGWPGLQTRPG